MIRAVHDPQRRAPLGAPAAVDADDGRAVDLGRRLRRARRARVVVFVHVVHRVAVFGRRGGVVLLFLFASAEEEEGEGDEGDESESAGDGSADFGAEVG